MFAKTIKKVNTGKQDRPNRTNILIKDNYRVCEKHREGERGKGREREREEERVQFKIKI